MHTTERKKKRYPSPYCIIPGESILADYVIKKNEADLLKLFTSHTYGHIEYLILESLYKFSYLNKLNITRYVSIQLKERSHNSYDNILIRLKKDGFINTVYYADNVFYTLTDPSKQYMNKKGSFLNQPERKYVKTEPVSILECASLAQYHISLMEKRIKNASFNQVRKFKASTLLPSYAEFTNGIYTYHLFGASLPKGNMGEEFLDYIKDIDSLITKAFSKKNHINLMIFIASSIKEIEGCDAFLHEWEDFYDRNAYYVLESNCKDMCALDCLYYYENDTDEKKLTTIRII